MFYQKVLAGNTCPGQFVYSQKWNKLLVKQQGITEVYMQNVDTGAHCRASRLHFFLQRPFANTIQEIKNKIL